MVECNDDLDLVFQSLSDSTRRDIISRVSVREQTISELAERYSMSFAGVAKHIKVLEQAKLVNKQKRGKEQIITANLSTIQFAHEYLEKYKKLWSDRFDRLEKVINKG